jgi:protein-arginine deiminase
MFADFDHDGVIDEPRPPADPAGQFAVVLPVSDIPSCSYLENKQWQLMGGICPLEVGSLKVRLNGTVPADSTLILRTDADSRGKVHLFQRCDTRWKSLGSEGLWRLAWDAGCHEVTLGVVASSFAQASGEGARKWSGEFVLTAAIAAEDGGEMAEDNARFRVAPFLLASALDHVEEVLVIGSARTSGFVEVLQRLLPQAGAGLQVIRFEGETESDVWAQDTAEIGRICVPAAEGAQQAIAVLTGIRAKYTGFNTEPLDRNIREHFRDVGAVIVDAAQPRAETRWIDWYGNLEVSPPVKSRDGREFPFGRILVGVQGGLGMHPDVLAFLEAQCLQWPPLTIDTSWLLVGHVDEVVSFVPAPDRRGFRVLLPSTSLAKAILGELASRGLAGEAVFAGHPGETTVAELLEKVAMSEENTRIQNILYETRACLREGLGVDDDDFIEIPVLFRDGVAVIPNCVNGLICNGHAVLPDPLGPQVDGDDAFAASIRTVLTNLGVKVHFVDVWESYHTRLGEIHCGTNAIRRIKEPAWWEVTES